MDADPGGPWPRGGASLPASTRTCLEKLGAASLARSCAWPFGGGGSCVLCHLDAGRCVGATSNGPPRGRGALVGARLPAWGGPDRCPESPSAKPSPGGGRADRCRAGARDPPVSRPSPGGTRGSPAPGAALAPLRLGSRLPGATAAGALVPALLLAETSSPAGSFEADAPGADDDGRAGCAAGREASWC